MKLRYSPSSPFVRKVCASAIEMGLDGAIERIDCDPMNPDHRRASPNPLGKVPCLETDDGLVLYDSAVIVAYLDSRHDGPKLVPAEGAARWVALRRQALGDGMLENVVAIFVERLRAPERQSRGFIAHNKAAVFRAVDSLEAEAAALDGPVDVGGVTLAVALSFVGQHFPDDDWRAGRPRLAAWFDAFDRRRSMTETVLAPAARGG